MVSRRKILSRSRDDLNMEDTFRPGGGNSRAEEEDVWYQKEKLYKVTKLGNDQMLSTNFWQAAQLFWPSFKTFRNAQTVLKVKFSSHFYAMNFRQSLE